MSLLLSAGHTEARRYPLGMVWDEANLVVDRQNGMEATRAVLLQMAISAVISEEGSKQFRKTIAGMTES